MFCVGLSVQTYRVAKDPLRFKELGAQRVERVGVRRARLLQVDVRRARREHVGEEFWRVARPPGDQREEWCVCSARRGE